VQKQPQETSYMLHIYDTHVTTTKISMPIGEDNLHFGRLLLITSTQK